MFITNLIFSSFLAFQPFEYNPIFAPQFDPNKNERFVLTENFISQLAISSWLIYNDIFIYTKPDYCRTNIVLEGKYINQLKTNFCIVTYEANVIADWFWQKNLWELGFLSAIVFNTFISHTLMNTDSTGICSGLYFAVINVAELLAIKSWSGGDRNIVIDIQVPLLLITF